jgi:hypothetical protein
MPSWVVRSCQKSVRVRISQPQSEGWVPKYIRRLDWKYTGDTHILNVMNGQNVTDVLVRLRRTRA